MDATKKKDKRKIVRNSSLLVMLLSLIMLFFPWRVIPYTYLRPEEEEAVRMGGDAYEQMMRDIIGNGNRTSYSNRNPKSTDDFTTEELLQLYDVPFTMEEYVTLINKKVEYAQQRRQSLITAYLCERNRDAVKTLRNYRDQHYLYAFSAESRSVPDSTYLRDYTISDETRNLLKMINGCVIAFAAGLAGFLLTTKYAAPSGRRKCMIVAVPLFLLLCTGLLVFYRHEQMLVRMKLIRQDGIAYLLQRDTLRVAGVYNLSEIGEELIVPESVQGYPVISVLSFSGPFEGPGYYYDGYHERVPHTIRRIVLPDSVRVLWRDALTELSKNFLQTEHFEIGNGVIWINTNPLERYGTDLIVNGGSLYIPSQVRYMSVNAFYQSHLQEVLFAKDMQIDGLPRYCFLRNRKLQHVGLPQALNGIGDAAFQGCSSLQSVSLPEGVKEIGGSAFAECSSLEQIVLPDAVSFIGGSAFEGCSSLTKVEGLDAERIRLGADCFFATPFSDNPDNFDTPLFVISGYGELLNVYGAGEEVTLPENVTSLDLLCLPQSVKTVIIPEGNTLDTITYRGQVMRDAGNPLVLHFEKEGAVTLPEKETYITPSYYRKTEEAVLEPRGFVIWECAPDTAFADAARDAGVPYRIYGVDDALSEDGYRVSYRISRSFHIPFSFSDDAALLHAEMLWDERTDAETEEPARYRCSLSVDVTYDNATAEIGSFVIDDMPADAFDIVPLSSIGFDYTYYDGEYGTWYLSVLCGRSEDLYLVKRYRLEKPDTHDLGIIALTESGQVLDDGYYLGDSGWRYPSELWERYDAGETE